jgi:hypothetical protein
MKNYSFLDFFKWKNWAPKRFVSALEIKSVAWLASGRNKLNFIPVMISDVPIIGNID